MSKTITTAQTTTLNVDASNENWVVDIGGSITVANGHGMVNSMAFHDSVMTTSGAIVADGMFKSGMFSEGLNAILQVDTAGTIHAYNGMAFYGEGTEAENLGEITAANIGIYGNAKDMDIVNTGTIDAHIGLYVENTYSSMSGFYNSGTITADMGIVTVNGGLRITNTATGVIDATTTAITLGEDQSGQAKVSNDGLIHSDDIAILGSTGRDFITNTGTIEGRIVLGAGNDYFRNTDTGTIDHAVDGGLGNDTYGFFAGAFDIIDAGGQDTIESTITRSLAPYANIENLALGGKDNINGTGNTLANIILGNDGNNILDGGNDNVIDILVGGSGNDTYILGSHNDDVYESAANSDPFSTAGGGIDTIVSTISRSLAAYAEVENLKLLGSGNLNGTGNYLANVITGTAGNNILDGGVEDSPQGAQIDTLVGGAGNDTYVLGSGSDKVIDSAGIDTITSEISRTLASYPTIENLTLLGQANLSGTGNALVNTITGNTGNNVLDGGIDTVVDTLKGGAGNDTYILGSGTDKIVETTGSDTIISTISRSLTGYANVENLTLKGTGNINATGNALANILVGNAGNNILDGGADNMADTLKGGLGNDTYVLGSGADLISDSGGNDTVTSTVSRSLASLSTIENLTLLGSANINATGNALNNVLTGNSGMNTLNGGAGNDIYMLGSGSDTVIDTSGIDTISSAISRSLASYASIENLILTGSANINATGNALNNVLTGNSGMNTLNGGAGNDIYMLGSGADNVVDSAGTDMITSLISRNLSTFATIENLKLLGVASINGTGNALANTLTGNSGINILSGAAGNDVLIGGAGADKLDGGANSDTASYAGASAGVVANLATASANTGDAKGDTYVSIENLTGSSYNDILIGNSAANVLSGWTGADKLTGGAGADIFLFKSAGDTTVATAGQDTIYDFTHGQGDKISLSGIDANSALTGDQAFVFKGSAAFSGTYGELRFDKQASDTYIYGDINGDKVADFAIHLDDAIALQASDFLF